MGRQHEHLSLIVVGLLLLIFIFILLDILIKNILLFFTRKVINLTKFTWDNHFYDNKVFNSVFHLIPLAFTRQLAPYVLYPTPNALNFIGKAFDILTVLIVFQLVIRITNAILSISTDENNYRTVAVRTFGQLMKISTIFFAAMIIASIMFNVKVNAILTGLGAATAILLLIFRDTILGFVSGVQIASTRMVKVGDWISIPKYNLEGVVKEINLVSCKLENFDKTISSIPTYDLITTEVKNFEAMRQTNTRRIKRSIVFNVKSFQFCTNEMLEKYEGVQADIFDHLVTASKEFDLEVVQSIPTN